MKIKVVGRQHLLQELGLTAWYHLQDNLNIN